MKNYRSFNRSNLYKLEIEINLIVKKGLVLYDLFSC
jgi:hypothetical protein